MEHIFFFAHALVPFLTIHIRLKYTVYCTDVTLPWYGGAVSTWTELQRLQRAACIMITRTMTTPTKVMEMLLDLPTLSTVVQSAALTAAYRLPRSLQKALEMRHGTIWKKAEKVDNGPLVLSKK